MGHHRWLWWRCVALSFIVVDYFKVVNGATSKLCLCVFILLSPFLFSVCLGLWADSFDERLNIFSSEIYSNSLIWIMTPYWQIGYDSFQVCNLLQIYLAAPVSYRPLQNGHFPLFAEQKRGCGALKARRGCPVWRQCKSNGKYFSDIKIQDIVSKFAAKAERQLQLH